MTQLHTVQHHHISLRCCCGHGACCTGEDLHTSVTLPVYDCHKWGNSIIMWHYFKILCIVIAYISAIQPANAQNTADLDLTLALLGGPESEIKTLFKCAPRLLSGNTKYRYVCYSKIFGSTVIKTEADKILSIRAKISLITTSIEEIEQTLSNKCERNKVGDFICDAGHKVSITRVGNNAEVNFCHRLVCE